MYSEQMLRYPTASARTRRHQRFGPGALRKWGPRRWADRIGIPVPAYYVHSEGQAGNNMGCLTEIWVRGGLEVDGGIFIPKVSIDSAMRRRYDLTSLVKV